MAARSGGLVNGLAALCAVGFIGVLGLSAYWDRTIRVLHLFEALPYALAAGLCLGGRKSGYALGVAAGGFWLYVAGTLTTFVRNGFERLSLLLRTGQLDRPDVLIAAPAAMLTGGLVLFSFWGYVRLRDKAWRDVGLFVAATVVVICFFLAIFAAFAPRYLAIFKPIFQR